MVVNFASNALPTADVRVLDACLLAFYQMCIFYFDNMFKALGHDYFIITILKILELWILECSL